MTRLESTFASGKFVLAIALLVALHAFAAPEAKTQTFTVIHNFTGGSDGASPLGGLYDDGGSLYGTASAGGNSGMGVVFKLSTAGQQTVLHEFTGGLDGANPEGHLVRDKSGNFYGTTFAGGVSNNGTVFEITRLGDETVLYSFTGQADGANPVAGLAIDKAGNLYGTTTRGGTSGNGTVFKLAIPAVVGGDWKEEVLYSFGTGSDGATPAAGVTLDSAGNLYGTTSLGGLYGDGTVFELLSASGWRENIIHHFELGSDGGVPYAGLALSNGHFYGATTEGGGGGQSGGGTIFELSKTNGVWSFNVLYGLTGWGISGSWRNLLVVSGKIYATTHCDGNYNAGTIYEMTESGGTWTYNQLHVFTGGSDGLYSISDLVKDGKGNFYGVTLEGGANGSGVAFKVTPN